MALSTHREAKATVLFRMTLNSIPILLCKISLFLTELKREKYIIFCDIGGIYHLARMFN